MRCMHCFRYVLIAIRDAKSREFCDRTHLEAYAAARGEPLEPQQLQLRLETAARLQ